VFRVVPNFPPPSRNLPPIDTLEKARFVHNWSLLLPKLNAKQEVAACDISMPPEPEIRRKLIPH
jgi:hypothetical protein